MNTYICPVDDLSQDRPTIKYVTANSLAEAEEKFEELFREDYDFGNVSNWRELREELNKQDFSIGDIYNGDEFSFNPS